MSPEDPSPKTVSHSQSPSLPAESHTPRSSSKMSPLGSVLIPDSSGVTNVEVSG